MGFRNGLAKVGRYYHFKFKLDGRVHHGSTGLESLAQAREWLRRYRESLILQGTGLAPIPTVATLASEWLKTKEGVLSQGHLDRARFAFRDDILPALGKLPLDRVTTAEVEAMLQAHLQRPKKNGVARSLNSRNLVLRYLNLLFGWAIKQGVLSKLPYNVSPMRVQQKPRSYVSRDRLEAFLASIDANDCLHLSVAVRAMVFMGLRESEALGMRWEWFSLDGATYTPGQTKGKEAVPLPVLDSLQEWLKKSPRNSPWVLPRPEGLPHHRGFTRRAIKRAGRAIGIENLTPHRLRATMATLLAQKGVSAHLLQRMLRHKSISTSLKYVELGLEDMRTAQAQVFGKGAPATQPATLPPEGKPSSDAP